MSEFTVKEFKSFTISTFTTHRKPSKSIINISRKGSIVKERCKQLCEIALNLFPDRVLTDADLTDLVLMYVGGDKETVRAYKGYYGRVRAGRCGDNRIVGLSRKGYLELFGFMHKIGNSRWVIHAQAQLPYQSKDSCDRGLVSNEKISISQSPMVSVVAGGDCGSRKELEEEESSEKERNFTPKICPKILDISEKERIAPPKRQF